MLFFATVVVMCALAAAAVIVSGTLIILCLLGLTGLATRIFPKHPRYELTLDDLRLSSAAPARWRF